MGNVDQLVEEYRQKLARLSHKELVLALMDIKVLYHTQAHLKESPEGSDEYQKWLLLSKKHEIAEAMFLGEKPRNVKHIRLDAL